MLFKQNKNRNKTSKKRKGSSPLTHLVALLCSELLFL